ncbi:MAG: hypothetical protein ACK5MU_03985 [Candidatus Saccharimonadales bacterium]
MKPSRFNINTDYATTINDDSGALTLTIPATFVIPAGSTISPFEATAAVGQKSASMRFNISSSKYPGKSVITPNFNIPATYTFNGQTTEDFLIGYIYRPATGQVRIHVEPNYSISYQDGATVTNVGQTITLKINTFLSPFES